MNILVLNNNLPVFPGWGGHEYLHTTHLAKYSEKLGLVSAVHTKEQDEKKTMLSNAGVSLYLWRNPNLFQNSSNNEIRFAILKTSVKFIYDIIRSRFLRPQDTLIEDLEFRNISSQILKAFNDDIWQALVIVQSSRAQWIDYLPPVPVSILVLHDVRALVYERRSKTAESLGEKLFTILQSLIYRRFEGRYCRKYDLVVTVSPDDEIWVRENYNPQRIVTIPIPVDTNYFLPIPDIIEVSSRILFTGMMNHPPNVDAACYFALQVFPLIRSTIHNAEFWIVGRDPTLEVKRLSNIPGITVTGFVEDIRLSMAQASVIVVPIRYGAGMRNKILEAWAMEKCVVSTTIGAEGLDYQDEKNLLIADDSATMADKVIEGIRNKELSDKIRLNGRDLVKNKHHPEKLALKYFNSVFSVFDEKKKQVKPIRVLVDLRWMKPGIAGGIENLTRSWLAYMLNFDKYNHYTILVPSEIKYDFDLRWRPNYKIIAYDGPAQGWRNLMWRCKRHFHNFCSIDYFCSQEVWNLKQASLFNADIALSISGYIRNDLYPLKNVLIVHDLQHEYHPEFFTSKVLDERKRVFNESIFIADHIIAVSEFTRKSIIELFSISSKKISTIYEAADPIFQPENRKDLPVKTVLRKYKLLDKEYVYFPANTWPHKNHKTALQALKILESKYQLKPILVCSGSFKEAHNNLLRAIKQMGLSDRVKFLGYCPTSDIPALYAGAKAMIYPSLFEGFGIPILEAMWCDCPVICSNVTSLPEVAGDAALMVDPHSPEELADGIRNILQNRDLRNKLIENGRKHVNNFSWKNFSMKLARTLYMVNSKSCK